MAANFSCLFSCDIVGMNMPDFDDKIGEKIRNDVTNKLLDELRDLMQRKWISSNKDTNFWMSSNIGLHYSNIEVQTADWICQNFLNIGEFLKAEMTHSGFSFSSELEISHVLNGTTPDIQHKKCGPYEAHNNVYYQNSMTKKVLKIGGGSVNTMFVLFSMS